MSSPLDSIKFVLKQNYIMFSIDRDWVFEDKVIEAMEKFDVEILSEKQILVKIKGNNLKMRAIEFCNFLNNDYLMPVKVPQFKKVVLSCIILTTSNKEFVKNKLIPSIVNNTSVPYEIVLVYNGYDKMPKMDNVKVVRSKPAWISYGYNLGAKYAKGEYLAIFHDDCIVRDKKWFEKCIENLNEEVIAVAPEQEFDNPFIMERLKCVPLVIKRNDFWKIGGFDEYYFFGKEELDFVFNILSKGFKYKKIDFGYEHYKAISTILLFSGRSDLEFYFGLNIVPKTILKEWTNYFLERFMAIGFDLVMYDNEVYFYEKFLPLFDSLGFDIELIRRYIKVIKDKIELSKNRFVYETYKSNRKKFIELVKNMKIR